MKNNRKPLIEEKMLINLGDISPVQTRQPENSRLRWITLNSSSKDVPEGADAIKGLRQTPETLPCRYFYDDIGSVLFEQICDQPEYYPTRAEQAMLEAYVSDIAHLTRPCELVELGSGSSRKTRLLLDADSKIDNRLQYFPIDVSAGSLKTTAIDLLQQYPALRLCGLAGTYEQALTHLPRTSLKNRMLIFLGSTLGNLDRAECDDFLTLIQQALQPGKFFLFGVDLQKPAPILEAAYNDAQGITAAFNLNILSHLNRQFQGNFVPEQFQHCAFYNLIEHRIEMYLKSLTSQTVILKALDVKVSFQPEETIRTEISRKFHLPTLMTVLVRKAISSLKTWTAPNDWFALLLCQRQCINQDCP